MAFCLGIVALVYWPVTAPNGWSLYVGDYDSTMRLQRGRSTVERARFWYTDAQGQRRMVGSTHVSPIELTIGQEVVIAVSPDGTQCAMIKPSVPKWRSRIALISALVCIYAAGMIAVR